MNLAEPAPKVEPAVAESAEYVEAATAGTAQPTEPATTTPVPLVGPAVPYDTSKRPQQATVSSSVSVAVLRGDTGADLECHAAVFRGAPAKNIFQILFPCIYDERDFVSFGEVKKYIVIKAGTCFVYGEESDPSPLYAIPLDELTAIQEDPHKPDPAGVTVSPLPNTNKPRETMKTIMLKYKSNGKQAYQFSFDTEALRDKSIPKRFMDLVQQSAFKRNSTDRVSASVVKAEQVRRDKAMHQPTI